MKSTIVTLNDRQGLTATPAPPRPCCSEGDSIRDSSMGCVTQVIPAESRKAKKTALKPVRHPRWGPSSFGMGSAGNRRPRLSVFAEPVAFIQRFQLSSFRAQEIGWAPGRSRLFGGEAEL